MKQQFATPNTRRTPMNFWPVYTNDSSPRSKPGLERFQLPSTDFSSGSLIFASDIDPQRGVRHVRVIVLRPRPNY